MRAREEGGREGGRKEKGGRRKGEGREGEGREVTHHISGRRHSIYLYPYGFEALMK